MQRLGSRLGGRRLDKAAAHGRGRLQDNKLEHAAAQLKGLGLDSGAGRYANVDAQAAK
jgi:hypothetical protein